MKVKISDLTNEQLDRLCAEAQGWEKSTTNSIWWYKEKSIGKYPQARIDTYSPTSNDAQAMALVKKLLIDLEWFSEHAGEGPYWVACLQDSVWYMRGDNPNIAICRAVVAAKFGEAVEVSE